jgi:hypothetical protein
MNSVKLAPGALLHRAPIVVVDLLLNVCVNSHYKVIADKVSLRKGPTFCVEALEHQVRIIVRFENNADRR